MDSSARPDAPGAAPRSSLFVLSMVTLAVMAVATPTIVSSSLAVLAVESSVPMEWVPRSFKPRQAYEQFTREFESGDVVVVSWPDCQLGSAAVDRVVAAAAGPDGPRNAAGRPWFDGVVSGGTVVERLMTPPLSLDRQTAVERLEGVLVGPDLRTTCVVFGFTPEGIADRRKALAWIRDLLRRTATTDDDAVHMAGPVVDDVMVDDAANESLDIYAVPAAIVVLLLTWWSLKSLPHALLVFAVSLWCVGFSFASLHSWGDRMNPVLIVMPLLVLVLGVSGGIHLVNYLVEAFASGGRRDAAARAIRLGWLPCLLSAGTTAIGLASLVTSELEPIRTFGFHGSIGVMMTLFCMFLVVPGIYERWPIATAAAAAADGPPRSAFAAGVLRHPAAVVALFFAAMAVAALGVPRIRTSVRIDTLFKPDSRVLRDYAWLEKHIGPLVPIEVVLEFAEQSPVRPAERLDLLEQVAEKLGESADGRTVMSAALFLPDLPRGSGPLASARRRVAARRLEQSLTAIDDMKYIRARDGGQLWRATAKISALRDVDYGELLDIVRADVEPIVSAAGGGGRGVSFACTGVMPLVHAIQNILLSDLFTSFLSACGLITLVMMAVERGVWAGLVAMISNVFPMILLFGAMGWTRMPLDVGSVMTASIALGMAIDGTLHFLTFYRRGIDAGDAPVTAVHAAYAHCAGAMTQSTVVCGLGILVFTLSSFAPTSRFAWMLAMLLAAALAGDLVLLPAMLVGPLGRFFDRRPR